jgi:hypothetical protein
VDLPETDGLAEMFSPVSRSGFAGREFVAAIAPLLAKGPKRRLANHVWQTRMRVVIDLKDKTEHTREGIRHGGVMIKKEE